MEINRLTREAAEFVSRDQNLRCEQRRQRNIHFLCSAGHVKDCQSSYQVDPYSCYMCDHTYGRCSHFRWKWFTSKQTTKCLGMTQYPPEIRQRFEAWRIVQAFPSQPPAPPPSLRDIAGGGGGSRTKHFYPCFFPKVRGKGKIVSTQLATYD